MGRTGHERKLGQYRGPADTPVVQWQSAPVLRYGRGLTLLELLFTLAVAGILLSVGVPSFNTVVANANRTSAANGLVAAVQLARSTAIRRNAQVVICADDGSASCTDAADWRKGWFVFVNNDRERPPRISHDDEILYRHGPADRVDIASNRSYFAFHRIGLRSTNGTLTICDNRGADHARGVIVSYTGRPRVARRQSDGSPLICF